MEADKGHSGNFLRFEAFHRFEDTLLGVFIGALVLLASVQILLRNLAGGSLPWADPLLRVLVLWVGLLGALVAARENRHISIDALPRWAPRRVGALMGCACSLFAAAVSSLVAWHSVRFVADEVRAGSTAFATVPAWACEWIVPFAFGVLAIRYTVQALRAMRRFLGTG